MKLQIKKLRNIVSINSNNIFYKIYGLRSLFIRVRKTSKAKINKFNKSNSGFTSFTWLFHRALASGKIKPFANTSRLYSNYSRSKINKTAFASAIADTVNIFENEVITFDSLELGLETIKITMSGVPGIYLLRNTEKPERFYIGSTINLARRLQEYVLLTNGGRKPKSVSEVEISKTPSTKWNLVILNLSIPQLTLVNEQFALIILKPTINRTLNVIPRINPQWKDLDIAIIKIKEYLDLFSSSGYDHTTNTLAFVRFTKFLKAYSIAKDYNLNLDNKTDGFSADKHYSNLIFVYDKDLPNNQPVVYSSINKALKSLGISYGRLLECDTNKYIFKKKFILSFEPLFPDNFKDYKIKPKGDNQLRKFVILFNNEGESLFEFNSEREMARHFNIDAKLVRTAIAKGEYLHYTLVSKLEPFRKDIFVFDSNTLELITKLKSITIAMSYAKVSFYTLKYLLETNKPHNGKYYSYSEKPPVNSAEIKE